MRKVLREFALMSKAYPKNHTSVDGREPEGVDFGLFDAKLRFFAHIVTKNQVKSIRELKNKKDERHLVKRCLSSKKKV